MAARRIPDSGTYFSKLVGFVVGIRNYFILGLYYRVGKYGKNVIISRGFKIFHGAKNIQIGNFVCLVDCLINSGDKNGKIIIGDYVFMGHRVMLLARSHDIKKTNMERMTTIIEKPIIIESGVWVGSGSVVLGGVRIGKNSVIGAGSVVTKNVPQNSIYAGIPAKFVKKIN